MRHALFALALVGCARGGVGQLAQGDANEIVIDGVVYKDAPDDHHDDAHVYMDAKQFEDAHEFHDAHVFMDAHVYMDAHVFMDACVPVQTQLLQNPAFDLDPVGIDWTETQVAMLQVVTNDSPQSVPYSLFLGGYTGYGTATDGAYQDIVIPGNVTALTLTGYYGVATNETPMTGPYDTAAVVLTQTNGTPIETVLSLDNNTNTNSMYVPLTHSFNVATLGGTTVRLKFTSTSDNTLATAFFFDTLALTATHCP